MPTIPAFHNPVLMFPASSTIVGVTQMTTYGVGGCAEAAGIFSFGGDLYQVVEYSGLPPFPTVGDILVYKSTDNGSTWDALDADNGPVRSSSNPTPSAGAIFDGAHTITIAFTTGSLITPASGPLTLQDFNLNTGTWGIPYDSGPTIYGTNQLFKRTDSSLVVIAVDAPNSLTIYVHTSSWAGFSLSGALTAGWVPNGVTSAYHDPSTDTIHIFGLAISTGPVKHVYYIQFTAGNSVSGFQEISSLFNVTGTTFAAMGNPLIYGSNLLWGTIDPSNSFATMIKGTPVSSPSFSVVGSPGVDPSQPIPGSQPSALAATLATDGVNLWAVFLEAGTPNQVRLSVTSNIGSPGTGWSGGIIYDDSTGPTPLPNVQYPSIAMVGGAPYITVQAGTSEPTNYALIPFGNTATADCSITINAPSLTASCNNPPNGTQGVPYNHNLTASGGTPPYNFTISSGFLPVGLILNATSGAITGTPTAFGTYPFSVHVTDSGSQSADISCSITINPSTLTASCNNPQDGVVGGPYTHQLTASGGIAPYNFVVIVGALPNGLALNATSGVISGTPVLQGNFPFSVRVTDSSGTPQTIQINCAINIAVFPVEVTVACNNPPDGSINLEYSHLFTASGGVPPYTFGIIAGSLPPGLSLDRSSGLASGIPTTNGTFSFTVQASDSSNENGTVVCSITIGGVIPPPPPPPGVKFKIYSDSAIFYSPIGVGQRTAKWLLTEEEDQPVG